MIIIADSGSTKTDWVILDGENQVNFKTKGINPFFLDEKLVIEEIKNHFPDIFSFKEVEEVHFYGPGCSTADRCGIVEAPMKGFFVNAKINIKSDLLAAGRALFQKESGIACILGTGSNSGRYDGKEIVKNISSIGYILGDEGSGANIGLNLIKHFLNHQLSGRAEDLFMKKFKLSTNQIIDRIYGQAYPNRFLASFAPFVKENIHVLEFKDIVEKSFSEFIEWHILPYQNSNSEPIAFVGSVAVEFKEELESVAKNKGLSVSKYLKNPIQELVRYHQK